MTIALKAIRQCVQLSEAYADNPGAELSTAEAHRAQLLALVDRMRAYLISHKPMCAIENAEADEACSCGLFDLLRDLDGDAREI